MILEVSWRWALNREDETFCCSLGVESFGDGWYIDLLVGALRIKQHKPTTTATPELVYRDLHASEFSSEGALELVGGDEVDYGEYMTYPWWWRWKHLPEAVTIVPEGVPIGYRYPRRVRDED